MQQLPISNIPNQSIDFQADGNYYTIVLRETAPEIISCDITKNGNILISGQRAVGGWPLIPYLNVAMENFTILTPDNEYPNWQYFGITQFLIYISQSEIQESINAQTGSAFS